jgi:hypothetical protein
MPLAFQEVRRASDELLFIGLMELAHTKYLSRTGSIGAGCKLVPPGSILRGLFDVIDDQNCDGAFGRLEF